MFKYKSRQNVPYQGKCVLWKPSLYYIVGVLYEALKYYILRQYAVMSVSVATEG